MSGPVSIAFAALAFFDAFSHRKEFVMLAFVALGVVVGRLTYKSIPRFKISTVSESEEHQPSIIGRISITERFFIKCESICLAKTQYITVEHGY